jgi:hypothetical protein
MRRKTTLILLAGLASGALVAGCGGGDDDGGDGGGEPPTKQEYIAEADQVCTESNQEFEQAIEDAPEDAGSATDYIADTLVPIFREEFEQLRELTPPEGDEATVAAIFDAGEEGVQQIEDDPEAFQGSGEVPGLEEASRLASQYGFEVCGQGGG